MEGGKQAQEFISALMDSELRHLTSNQIDALYHSQEQKNTWSLYHQIGDTIRFEYQHLSQDFQEKLSKRIALESELIAPQQKHPVISILSNLASKKLMLIAASLAVIVILPLAMLGYKVSFSGQKNNASDVINLQAQYSLDDRFVATNNAVNNLPRMSLHDEEYLFAHQNTQAFIFNATNFSHQISLVSPAGK